MRRMSGADKAVNASAAEPDFLLSMVDHYLLGRILSVDHNDITY